MIYPGTYNIVLLQNSTWRQVFRLSDSVRPVTLDANTSTFASNCHKLSVNNKVYFTPSDSNSRLPCGLEPTTVYYVISSGLTNDAFKVSASLGGVSIAPYGFSSASFTCSKPLDLTGFIIDADIKDVFSNDTVKSMTATMLDALNGLVEMSLTPVETLDLKEGTYIYDSSLTSPGGERYYWISGSVMVQKTFSRN